MEPKILPSKSIFAGILSGPGLDLIIKEKNIICSLYKNLKNNTNKQKYLYKSLCFCLYLNYYLLKNIVCFIC